MPSDTELDEILDNKPIADVPDDIWETLHPTWTGLWTDAYGQWDELQASDVFPISELLSDKRLAWLKSALTAWKAKGERRLLARFTEFIDDNLERFGTVGDCFDVYVHRNYPPQDPEAKQ